METHLNRLYPKNNANWRCQLENINSLIQDFVNPESLKFGILHLLKKEYSCIQLKILCFCYLLVIFYNLKIENGGT